MCDVEQFCRGMLVCFKWRFFLTFVVRVCMDDDASIGQFVRMQEYDIIYNEQAYCKREDCSSKLLHYIFQACSHRC